MNTNYYMHSLINSILTSMKNDFFRVNTASIYQSLPLEREEINELMSNQFLALESRFAILNKNKEFKSLLEIGNYVFIDISSNNFNTDIDYKNNAVRTCLHFLIDASYSYQDFNRCILFGEQLLNEIQNSPNNLFDPDKKDILMALSMAYGKILQFEKSDYYEYLANKPEPIKNIETNKLDLNHELFLYRGEVDKIRLGSKLEDIIQLIGKADKRTDNERMYGIPQTTHLSYYQLGIQLRLQEGILTDIWLKSGRNHGNANNENLFVKYKLSLDSSITLDSKIEDVESVYGKALREYLMSNNDKILYKIYRYRSFDINVIIKTGEIATIRLSNVLKLD